MYKNLEARFAKISDIKGATSMLSWDRAVLMPKRSVQTRARQMSTLKSMAHELLIDKEVGTWLKKAEAENENLSNMERANLNLMSRQYKHATAMPIDLLTKLSHQQIKTETLWETARPNNDFDAVKDDLKYLIALTKEKAKRKAEILEIDEYDALIDDYDPYNRADKITLIFDDLKEFLPPFIKKVMDKQKGRPPIIHQIDKIDVSKQHDFAQKLAEKLGFDFERGRLDTSSHPFSGGTIDDQRITTCYNEHNLLKGLSAVTHEIGHALYDAGFPDEWKNQPVGYSFGMGMSVHESQSLMLENRICKTPEFFQFLSKMLKDEMGLSGDIWNASNMHHIATDVKPSLIRIYADEVTYPLHVILRYELERDLISGDLLVDDLPEAWRYKMKTLIGIEPKDDTDGCMQDCHWYQGAFGYFPSYTLGALAAAQIFAKLEADIPKVKEHISEGDMSVIMDWLNKNMRHFACMHKPMDLIEIVSGKPLGINIFKDYLNRSYLS